MNQILEKGGPVMYPIIGCSIISLAIIMERFIFWISRNKKKERITIKEMTRFLSLLDTMVTVSPLLGILGTVTGIIKCFDLLGNGVRDVIAISGGIAEALITTAAGLIVAIPSVVAYNHFVSRCEKAVTEVVEREPQCLHPDGVSK